MKGLQFVAYHLLGDTPNVVVDGAPAASTVLTLSHWPGSPTPTEVLDDLSAQIAFRALDHPDWFHGVHAVSNNHFDQDGLASAYVLLQPDDALARMSKVVDVASAGDFARFHDRDAMRIAMAIAALDNAGANDGDGGGYEEHCARMYQELLPRFTEMLDHPERWEHLWRDEDAHLTESLAAIDAGTVQLAEYPELDLAVCVVPDAWAERTVTRFTVAGRDALHPAALPNRTDCMRLLVSHDGSHRLMCRYETWVMFRSRPLAPRPDLRVLAAALDLREGRTTWHADAPGSLTPELTARNGTGLGLDEFEAEVREFLRDAPPAWDPFAAV